MSRDTGNIFSRLLASASPSLFGGFNQPAQIPTGFIGPTQPQPQGPAFPNPTQRVGQFGQQAGRATNRLFENPAFTTALASFGQRLTQAGAQGQGFGQGFTGALGGFAPDFIAAQQQATLAKQEQARNAIVDQLRQAQTTQIQAQTAVIGEPKAITPFQTESLDLRRQELEAKRLERAAPKKFTTLQKDERRKSLDQLQAGLDTTRTLLKELKETPSRFGALGTARGIVESGLGILGDLGGFAGIPQIAAGAREAVSGKTVRALRPLENKLVLAVARSNQGDTGRVLSKQIELARENVAITGAFGGQQAGDALRTIEKQLEEAIAALGARARAGGFDIKIKPKPGANLSDVSDQNILRALGL